MKEIVSIPYAHHYLDKDDIKGVVEVLRSDWLTQGPKVKEFEEVLCRYTGAKYAVAVSSGTAALHLSMLALGIERNDRVITSPITFSATANCVLYVGARPIFIDIDDRTYHLDINRLKDFLKVRSQREGVKALILVHFMGTVADVVEAKNLCDKYGIKVVEDAAHAFGAMYKFKIQNPESKIQRSKKRDRAPSIKDDGQEWVRVGACKHSDITIFSFHPIKHITTGEGGAILTNDRNIYKSVLSLRHHGIIKHKRNFWSYDIPKIGFNYRITDFQCALGISQLKKIDKIVETRRRLAKVYNKRLSKIYKIRLPYEKDDIRASYHIYVIRVPGDERDRLYRYLRRHYIFTQVNYIPVHLFSYYKSRFGYKEGDFPISERYSKECLSLPLYVGLSKSQQSKIIRYIERFFAR